MKLCSIGDYEVHVPTSGGKAGKGCNKTTGIQIRRGGLILKTFRVKADAPMPTVMKKVNDWIGEQESST